MREYRDYGSSIIPKLFHIFHGEVASLQSYGAFVKIPGCRKQGLVHKSQMSNGRVDDPSDMVTKGDMVYCKVISMEGDGEKISLSMKVVNQSTGKDLDPNNVQSNQDEKKRRSWNNRGRSRIDLGAELNTTCRRCGMRGHLAMDCYTKKGDRGYDLVPEDDESGDRSDDSHKKKKKKDKKKKEKRRRSDKRKHSSSNSESDNSDSEDQKGKKSKKERRADDSEDEASKLKYKKAGAWEDRKEAGASNTKGGKAEKSYSSEEEGEDKGPDSEELLYKSRGREAGRGRSDSRERMSRPGKSDFMEKEREKRKPSRSSSGSDDGKAGGSDLARRGDQDDQWYRKKEADDKTSPGARDKDAGKSGSQWDKGYDQKSSRPGGSRGADAWDDRDSDRMDSPDKKDRWSSPVGYKEKPYRREFDRGGRRGYDNYGQNRRGGDDGWHWKNNFRRGGGFYNNRGGYGYRGRNRSRSPQNSYNRRDGGGFQGVTKRDFKGTGGDMEMYGRDRSRDRKPEETKARRRTRSRSFSSRSSSRST
ncbi:uncharacterized protein DDB_G0283697-like [Physella acuta]|uniref:uncharacterized protein DDB_G0283697-like n=1 Tax=Physella acuta TaxID=109671 RepID=UPI0027DE1E80|nr:uncharacterized protein DDB_G0283697-like [Physella acuta]